MVFISVFVEIRIPTDEIEIILKTTIIPEPNVLLPDQFIIKDGLSNSILKNSKCKVKAPNQQDWKNIPVENGSQRFKPGDEGSYTFKFSAIGFREYEQKFIFVDNTILNEVKSLFLVPEFDDIIVILSWRASISDLDIHVVDSLDQHVYSKQPKANDITLEIQENFGGPETIRFKKQEGIS